MVIKFIKCYKFRFDCIIIDLLTKPILIVHRAINIKTLHYKRILIEKKVTLLL